MKILKLFVALFLLGATSTAQQSEEVLPRFMTEAEKEKRESYTFTSLTKGTETPPPFENLRSMA
ncbi:MAG: hypothetical protein AAF551_15140, partial [Bacteroidota bacterium]